LPAYPNQALLSGTQGEVIFKILVNEEGKIVSVDVVEGDPLLTAASADALRKFRFRPYLLNGAPIQVESQLEYKFSLKGKGADAKGKVEYVSNIPYRPEFRPGAVTAGGVLILWARQISGPEPKLPPELAGKPGTVYLTITIGVDGKVQNVKVVGGDEPFIAPVVEAVKQSIYEPAIIAGKPSIATTEATYHFGPNR
jgi:TonB family protein